MSYYHKYLKYKQKYNQLKGGVDNEEYYYHGSKFKITDFLEPRPSRVIDGDEAVFATNTRWLAIYFIASPRDTDIEVGFIHNDPYIMEQWPGAFDKVLRNKRGYLYSVKKDQFHSDPRLGMKRHEFISDDKVKIEKTEVIDDVYEEIEKADVAIIDFSMKEEFIAEAIQKLKGDKQKKKQQPKQPGERF